MGDGVEEVMKARFALGMCGEGSVVFLIGESFAFFDLFGCGEILKIPYLQLIFH